VFTHNWRQIEIKGIPCKYIRDERLCMRVARGEKEEILEVHNF